MEKLDSRENINDWIECNNCKFKNQIKEDEDEMD